MEKIIKTENPDYAFTDGSIAYQRGVFGHDGEIEESEGSRKIVDDQSDPGINPYAAELGDDAVKVMISPENRERESLLSITS